MSQDKPEGLILPRSWNDKEHDNPELHYIGGGIQQPTTVTDVAPGGTAEVGVKPSPAREDHKHGLGIIDLSTGQVIGTLPVAKGGTGLTTLTAGRYLKGNGTSAVDLQAIPIPVADGGIGAITLAANAFLKGNGTGAIQTQSGINYSDIVNAAGSALGGTMRRNAASITMSSETQVYVKLGRLVLIFYNGVSNDTTSGTDAEFDFLYGSNIGTPAYQNAICGLGTYYDTSAGLNYSFYLKIDTSNSRFRFWRTDDPTADPFGDSPNPLTDINGDTISFIAVLLTTS